MITLDDIDYLAEFDGLLDCPTQEVRMFLVECVTSFCLEKFGVSVTFVTVLEICRVAGEMRCGSRLYSEGKKLIERKLI